MTNDELKDWLRAKSSGVYRPSAVAADVIDGLERENARLREALLELHAIAKASAHPNDYVNAKRMIGWLDRSGDLLLPNANMSQPPSGVMRGDR